MGVNNVRALVSGRNALTRTVTRLITALAEFHYIRHRWSPAGADAGTESLEHELSKQLPHTPTTDHAPSRWGGPHQRMLHRNAPGVRTVVGFNGGTTTTAVAHQLGIRLAAEHPDRSDVLTVVTGGVAHSLSAFDEREGLIGFSQLCGAKSYADPITTSDRPIRVTISRKRQPRGDPCPPKIPFTGLNLDAFWQTIRPTLSPSRACTEDVARRRG